MRKADAPRAPQQPVVPKGLRALLVDDLPDALVVIRDRLTTLDVQVDTASSSRAGPRRVDAEMFAGRARVPMLIDRRMLLAGDDPLSQEVAAESPRTVGLVAR